MIGELPEITCSAYTCNIITRVTLCVAVLAQQATMPISCIEYLGFPLPSKLNLCCTCRSRDKGVVSFVYAAALATKRTPLCCQSWKNEAKSRPIDRPGVATSLPSATGQTTLGQKGAIVFSRANTGKHSPAET